MSPAAAALLERVRARRVEVPAPPPVSSAQAARLARLMAPTRVETGR